MSRKPNPPKTALGAAIRARRVTTGEATAEQLGISKVTLYRLERGDHSPTASTALKLARWLGWTMEQVVEAAAAPTTPPDPT